LEALERKEVQKPKKKIHNMPLWAVIRVDTLLGVDCIYYLSLYYAQLYLV
jgi:hypothetical protein